tara:strand:- start:13 stop:174 length:162 start_codon:yes stop_codon:yes gene_type:complete
LSGLLPLLKLIFDSGAVSPKAPTEVKIFGRRKITGVKDKPGTAFGELGFKKFF